jgi:hypothetical protein
MSPLLNSFPLYGKGQDRNRFEYGVFLLNKDIEQVRKEKILINVAIIFTPAGSMTDFATFVDLLVDELSRTSLHGLATNSPQHSLFDGESSHQIAHVRTRPEYTLLCKCLLYVPQIQLILQFYIAANLDNRCFTAPSF